MGGFYGYSMSLELDPLMLLVLSLNVEGVISKRDRCERVEVREEQVQLVDRRAFLWVRGEKEPD